MSKSITLSAIDIGTNSAKMLVGKKNADSSSVEVLAKESIPYWVGVRQGEVSHPEEIADKLGSLKEKVSSYTKINQIFVSAGGPRLFSMESKGVVSVSRADGKISKQDLNRMIETSKKVNLPSNKQILEIVPQEFIVDGEKVIESPLGLEGTSLEGKVVLIGVFSLALSRLKETLEMVNIEVEEEDIMPSPLASARAVLDSQQKELGSVVVDIGAGTTSLTIFNKGKLIDFMVLSMGSNNITNDIAIGLRTNINTAEEIKKKYARFKNVRGRSSREEIKLPEKEVEFTRDFLDKIVEARISEMFNEIAKRIKKTSRNTMLPGGVILTGGGSRLPGLINFGKKKFELPCCRQGVNNQIPDLDDLEFSTVAGTLLSGFEAEGGKGGGKGGSFKEMFRKIFKMFLP